MSRTLTAQQRYILTGSGDEPGEETERDDDMSYQCSESYHYECPCPDFCCCTCHRGMRAGEGE